jgi:hypothetical protein
MNNQLVRLRQDAEELQYFLKRLEKEGEEKKIPFIKSKIEYMLDAISRLEQKLQDEHKTNQE